MYIRTFIQWIGLILLFFVWKSNPKTSLVWIYAVIIQISASAFSFGRISPLD